MVLYLPSYSQILLRYRTITFYSKIDTLPKNAPEHQKRWMEIAVKLSDVSKLGKKTDELAYIAVLAALRLENGIPFHVKHAKMLGASRDEIISAVLIGLPAAENAVIQSIPIALKAYDESD